MISKMIRSNALSELLEAFMPSIRMAVLSIFCLVIGKATCEEVEMISQESYSFQALKARVVGGPGALTTVDILLYFAVLTLAFEVFNYISIHLGGKARHSLCFC
jgi:hypothetical protein